MSLSHPQFARYDSMFDHFCFLNFDYVIPLPSDHYCFWWSVSLMLWLLFLLLFSIFSLCLSACWLWLILVFYPWHLSQLEFVDILVRLYMNIFHQIWEVFGLYFDNGLFSLFLFSPFGIPITYMYVGVFNLRLSIFLHSLFHFRLHNLYCSIFKFFDFLNLPVQIYCWDILVNFSFQLLYFSTVEVQFGSFW